MLEIPGTARPCFCFLHNLGTTTPGEDYVLRDAQVAPTIRFLLNE